MPSEGKQSEGKDDDGDIVEAVKVFCCNGDFEEAFERFAKEKGPLFYDSAESKSDDPEHKLEYSDAHQEYLELFEGKIQGFLDDRGYSIQDFYVQAKKMIDAEAGGAWFIDMLLSMMEYKHFYGLMLNEARRQKMK